MQAAAFQGLVDGVSDMITVERVYGDPSEKNGFPVILAPGRLRLRRRRRRRRWSRRCTSWARQAAWM